MLNPGSYTRKMACFPGPKTLPRNNSLQNPQDAHHPCSPLSRNPAHPRSPLPVLLTAAVSAGINHPPLPGCVWRSCSHRSRMAGMAGAAGKQARAAGQLRQPAPSGWPRHGTVGNSTAWHSVARLRAAQHGVARLGTARHGG